jgi:uncharacterized membrane protein (UPF0182 family)
MDGDRPPFESIFENIRRDVDPAAVRRATRFLLTIVGLFVLFVVVSGALVPSTEYLWFLHDARHPDVFTKAYQARGLLFSISFVVGWLFLYFNLKVAFNQTMVFLDAPSSAGARLVTNAISFVQTRGKVFVRFGAPIIAFFSALDFGNEWSTWLLASHAQSFGVKDPTYGLDLGFFVFTLPWLRAVTNFSCALLILTTLTTVGVYAGLQGMAAFARIELGRPGIRAHIHTLIGLTILGYAVQIFLKTYEAGLVESGQFTGAGYAAMQGIMVQRFVAGFAVLVGIATIANGWMWRPYLVPIRGVIALVAVYILGVGAYTSLLQRLVVDPDRVAKESPYAAKAIEMTRFAYDLNRIKVRNESPNPVPSQTDVSQSQSTLDNMRLWDPTVLREALEGYQAIRPYYRFYDVSIDRYTVDGAKRLLMLSPRLIDLNGLQSNARNWTNERLQYTHGYGVVVTRVDQQTTDGEPVMLDNDVPQRSNKDLAVTQPDLYYGNAVDENGDPVDEYAIVDTGQAELDYPTSDTTVTTHWTGTGGIPIGNFLSKLAFSAVLGDGNLLVSPEIKSSSRLLMHRSVWERATRIYPFLKFDADPYIVILNGRLLWVMDGYTTSDMVPYSAMSGDTQRVNYIRNTCKITIDAYTGDTNAYEVVPNEPILKAWEAIYPGLIHPASQIPAGLTAHFRYPEDILTMQSNQLCAYHVTDPQAFLNNSGLWNIAAERGVQGDKETLRPFYVELTLPGEAGTNFVQMLPFTPNGRINMSGWLAAQCDPGHYGELTLYDLAQSNPIPGPEQMEGTFNATPDISNINRQFQNQQSQIMVGNLLTVPVGSSFMFAESLFLKSNTQDLQSVPRLAKVILALSNKVVVRDTYPEALQALLGNTAPTTSAPSTPTNAPSTPAANAPTSVNAATIKAAVDLLDQADKALRTGDFAKYGELQKQARQQLNAALTPPSPKAH